MTKTLPELNRFVEALLNGQFPGRWVANGWDDDPSSWTLRSDAALTHLSVYEQAQVPMLQVTCGLATDVPISDSELEWINATNSSIVLGRIFRRTDISRSVGGIVMQDIWPLNAVSYDDGESQEQIAMLLGGLIGQADRTAPSLLVELGGRSFRDDENILVGAIGDGEPLDDIIRMARGALDSLAPGVTDSE